MLWKALQALKSCTLLPNLSPHCAVSQIIYLLILLSWPRESIESLLIKFADEMTRRLENSFGIKNEFNQLEGIYALDKDCTRWPLWSFSTLRFYKKKKLWNPSKNIGKTYRKYMDSMNSVWYLNNDKTFIQSFLIIHFKVAYASISAEMSIGVSYCSLWKLFRRIHYLVSN